MTELTRVYAVVYSNHEPPEVLDLYSNEAAALAHQAANPGAPLLVVEYRVADEYDPAGLS